MFVLCFLPRPLSLTRIFVIPPPQIAPKNRQRLPSQIRYRKVSIYALSEVSNRFSRLAFLLSELPNSGPGVCARSQPITRTEHAGKNGQAHT